MRRWLLVILVALLGLSQGVAAAQNEVLSLAYGRGVPKSVFWSSDGKSFVVVTGADTLWRYDGVTLAATATLEDVTDASFTPNGKWLITQNSAKRFAVRSAADPAQIVLDNFTNTSSSPGGRWLLTWSGDNRIALRSSKDPRQVVLQDA